MALISVHPEVDDALRRGHAVVALETAVLTHGLPRTPLEHAPPANATGWNTAAPVNIEAMRAMQRAVREGGAVPATVAVLGSTLHIGVDPVALTRLGADPAVSKAGTATLAHAMTRGAGAGTTVSATLAACGLPPAGRIRVLATGGIGGVHPGWQDRPDISTDLTELAASPVCVVCAGAKSILDLPATVEMLETLGVPVVGYGTDHFPVFHRTGSADLEVRQRADDPETVARICRTHWTELRRRSAVILAVPVPAGSALARAELDDATRDADAAADRAGIQGPDRTPFVLDEVSRLTGGRTLAANIALLVNNASVAASVATSLAASLAASDATSDTASGTASDATASAREPQ